MHTGAGDEEGGHREVTRRNALKGSLTTGLGLGATALLRAARPSAVAAAPVYGGHAVVLNTGYPEVWDPHLAGTIYALAAISPMYNQLVEFNPLNPSEVIGDLATSWEVKDAGGTYIFHLHENVQWWDGQNLTAEDVALSLQRMIEPGKPRPRTGLLRPYIHAIEVRDRHTVQVTLHYPSPAFLPFLAVDYMKIVPKHLLEAGVDINVWENIIGSGPFKVKGVRRGEAVTYEKNPQYFKPGRPYVDGLTIMAISDAGTVAAALKAGRITMTTGATSLGPDDAPQLAKDLQGKYTLYWQPINAGLLIFGNVERAPWHDLRLLKALRLATDPQEFQSAFGRGKWALGAPFPPDAWYGSPTADLLTRPGYRRPKAPDIAAAKALLKEAGYDPPARLGKRMLTVAPAPALDVDLVQLWAAQMRRNLGLDIEVKVVDAPTRVHTAVAGDFDLALFGYAFNIDDPDDWVNAVYGPGARNYTRWKHPAFLTLFDQQSREVDRAKRLQILRQMEDFLFTVEDPYIHLLWASLFYVVSDKVRTAAGPFVPASTLQVMHKQEHWWLER
jgi:peptide/nickel transport system substrate-binding protein